MAAGSSCLGRGLVSPIAQRGQLGRMKRSRPQGSAVSIGKTSRCSTGHPGGRCGSDPGSGVCICRLTDMTPGWLLKRYKRFLADVEFEQPNLEGERQLTVYCPNTGPMTGLLDQPKAKVLMSQSDNLKRKYKFTLESIYLGSPQSVWVGIHSGFANTLVKEMLEQRLLKDLEPYEDVKQEVRYGGSTSRADFLLTTATGREMYVEVKSVTLAEACNKDAIAGESRRMDGRIGLFPDTVSTRAQIHLRELMRAMSQGKDAACVFVIQRGDCHSFAPCHRKDPEFSKLLNQAHQAGMKVLALRCATIDVGSEWEIHYIGKAQIDWEYGIDSQRK